MDVLKLIWLYIFTQANNKVVYLIDLYTQSKHEELVILILYLFYLGISLCFMIRIFRTFGKLLGMVCLKHYEFYVLNRAHVFQEITGINLTAQKTRNRIPTYPFYSYNSHPLKDIQVVDTILLIYIQYMAIYYKYPGKNHNQSI